MTTNPVLGTMIFALGGLAGAIFTLPFKKEKGWAWESYWMIYAIIALAIAPITLAFLTVPNLCSVLSGAPSKELLYCYLCGAAWGFGGITWGLMIRYLGVGLGLAIGCGLCSAAGTVIPKVIDKTYGDLFQPGAGLVSLAGVVISIIGIVLVGMAGMSKEGELPEEEKKKAVAEYNFKKGILVAIFSGLASAALNFGLQGGKNLAELAAKNNVDPAWQGMPVLVVCLLGGFTVNIALCIFLNLKNKTAGDYFKKDAPGLMNFVWAAIAGLLWVSQFVAFKTGEPLMGSQAYVGWAVLMASTIMFSSMVGIFLGEWKGTTQKTRGLLWAGLLVLLLSAVIGGYSSSLKKEKSQESVINEIQKGVTE